MEAITTLPKVDENEHLESGEFKDSLSKTYGIKVGCGTLYITICFDEGHRFRRLFISRTSKFHCDIIIRDGLARLASYQGKRNLSQLIGDLRGDKFGHHCEKFNVLCEASSCFDAVSKALDKWRGKDEKAQKDNKEKES